MMMQQTTIMTESLMSTTTFEREMVDVQRDSGNSSDFSSSCGGNVATTTTTTTTTTTASAAANHDKQKTSANAARVLQVALASSNRVECCLALDDPAMFNDERTLENLLYLEDFYRIHADYFIFTQTEVKPWMHKTLAKWMLEVRNRIRVVESG